MKIEIDAITKEVEITEETEIISEGDSVVFNQPTLAEKNRADLDYIAIMMEVEL